MITIAREFHFDAAHRLPHVDPDHKCHRLHGHTWIVKLWVGGDMDPDMGWLLDYGELKRIWKHAIDDVIDHRYLNEIEGLENPTTEEIAPWIAGRLDAALDPYRVVALEVREGLNNWTRWEP